MVLPCIQAMLEAPLIYNHLQILFQDLSDNKDVSIPVVYYYAASTLQNKHQGAITDIKWLPPEVMVRLRGGWGDNLIFDTAKFLFHTFHLNCAPFCKGNTLAI